MQYAMMRLILVVNAQLMTSADNSNTGSLDNFSAHAKSSGNETVIGNHLLLRGQHASALNAQVKLGTSTNFWPWPGSEHRRRFWTPRRRQTHHATYPIHKWHDDGEGPAVIFFHGANRHWRDAMWQRLAHLLKERGINSYGADNTCRDHWFGGPDGMLCSRDWSIESWKEFVHQVGSRAKACVGYSLGGGSCQYLGEHYSVKPIAVMNPMVYAPGIGRIGFANGVFQSQVLVATGEGDNHEHLGFTYHNRVERKWRHQAKRPRAFVKWAGRHAHHGVTAPSEKAAEWWLACFLKSSEADCNKFSNKEFCSVSGYQSAKCEADM